MLSNLGSIRYDTVSVSYGTELLVNMKMHWNLGEINFVEIRLDLDCIWHVVRFTMTFYGGRNFVRLVTWS